jgi:hypothetical protein
MSKLRRIFMSAVVSIMITDLVLIAFACVPESAPSSVAFDSSAAAMTPLSTNPQIALAGGGGGRGLVEPAFWGKIWRAVKRIGACVGCGITSYDSWCRYCREGDKSLYRNNK